MVFFHNFSFFCWLEFLLIALAWSSVVCSAPYSMTLVQGNQNKLEQVKAENTIVDGDDTTFSTRVDLELTDDFPVTALLFEDIIPDGSGKPGKNYDGTDFKIELFQINLDLSESSLGSITGSTFASGLVDDQVELGPISLQSDLSYYFMISGIIYGDKGVMFDFTVETGEVIEPDSGMNVPIPTAAVLFLPVILSLFGWGNYNKKREVASI